MLIRQQSWKCVRGYWQPFGKFVTGCQRVFATFRQIFCKVSEVIGNPLKNSLEDIDICQRGDSTLWHFAGEYWVPSVAVGRGYWITSIYICIRVAVPDKRSRIHEVVVVRRLLTWLLGIWSGEGMGKGWERGGQFTSNLRPRWTDPVTARRVSK
jgi:hypothetical protein